eukprot:Macronucleus_1002.p1 GENE.Macronucleus_1002~~Macronucleus_1002.p1  ORF type:complete len:302 (+),score=87.86 Macronucleus_1002:1-906(+)
MLFFESRRERKDVLDAILVEQGFANQLDQYAITRKASEGCSNPVIIASHKLTGAKVAIKSIEKNKYARLQKEDRVSEAEALELCQDSAHIVNLIEKFTFQGEIYLVTKYASGGDLLQYCLKQEQTGSKTWMSEARAKHIFRQLALGLNDMHEQGLMHRDLKLLNIFMCDDTDMPRVKIGDLGLTVRLQPGEGLIKRAGTVAFMAPEVVLEEPCDFKSDIYSLGIILYTLISSHLPFEADQYTTENMVNLIECEIPFDKPEWQNISPGCIELLSHMLKNDQTRRFSIKQVLTHPWVTTESSA